MKPLHLLALCGLLLSAGCAGRAPENAVQPAPVGKAVSSGKEVAATDDWDDAAEVKVSDPLQPVNRAIFWFNHGLYMVAVKPIAKTYKFIVPEIARKGIHNAYENVRFPVRVVNHTLQGRFDRAAKETGRFLVNTTAGVGGLMTPSDKIPALADVPKADTGQTFAKWGIPHGPYLVIPLLGPSSTRDLFGTAGDTALNPVSWVGFAFGGAAWTLGVSTPYTVKSLPDQMDNYDTVTKNALDRYIAARSAYIQYRDAAAKR